MDAAAASAGTADNHVPGPSPNPATNLLIHDIVLRSIGRLSRISVEKAMLGRKYGREFARETVDNRSSLHALAAYGVTKVATRSIPGFALVTTGLILKTLFDRSQSRRKAQREGAGTLREGSGALREGSGALREQADPDDSI